ncbi:GPI ethanolamine phosphate transferase 3 [Ambystoma mexicanum]|uniref:GPI ethanolamine phosphate transferase 3 n=1 Tax=Ambystoma mexicanum TaxID=8296 RepID=UPI0037E8CEE6
MKRVPVLIFLAWACFWFYSGIWLFMSGFLLMRIELNNQSRCSDVYIAPYQMNTQDSPDSCWMQQRFQKAVIIVIDALKFEFAQFDPTNNNPKPFENKLGIIHQLISSQPRHARLYQFRADPPTTTMQRIKGMTTGSLPTFIDVGSNFATYAIQEDNLIDQFVQNGRKVVFMGDDTWDGLFPKKFHKSYFFPSFNVKDLHTVDDGILQNLYPTVDSDEWDVLIAHFLGVDHCGHKHGPDHPETAKKLLQMNEMLRTVIEHLDEDTLLVVMGDHGMTDTGDHGGDSEKEVNAALFVYSKIPLFDERLPKKPEAVPQVNLVPTLALLLGIPIPFSNIGMVMADLFSSYGDEDFSPSYAQALAYHINSQQVSRFLDSYSQAAEDLPAEKLRHLRELFAAAEEDYVHLFSKAQKTLINTAEYEVNLQRLIQSFQHYLQDARGVCIESWARFYPLHMVAGCALLATSCFLCYIVSEMLIPLEDTYRRLVFYPLLWGLAGAALLRSGPWASLNKMELLPVCFWATMVSQLAFFYYFLKQRSQKVPPAGLQSPTVLRGMMQRFLFFLRSASPLAMLFLRCAAMFSDSFVVAEGWVAPFLLQSLVILLIVNLHWDGKLMVPPIVTNCFIPDTNKQSTVIGYRKEGLPLLGLLASFLACVYVSRLFHNCRDESPYCVPSPFLTPLSEVQNSQMKNLSYGVCVACLAVMVYLVKRWLRHYGNLNSSNPLVFFVRLGFPLLVLWISCYWAISSGTEDSLAKLREVIQMALAVCPRAIFTLIILGLLIVLWNPLMVYMKDSRASEGKIVSGYQGAPCSEAELLHVIPQIYRRMQESLKSQLDGHGGKTTVVAYGLGSVFSAVLVVVLFLLGFFFLVLHSERMCLSFLLLLVEAYILLQIHGHAVNLSTSFNGFEHFLVPWYAVIAWIFTATQFFYSTGHQPIFPAIHWNAAFVGFQDGHSTNLLPALLVGANTFSSHILFGVGCPLLLLWPFLGETLGSRKQKLKKALRDMRDEEEQESPLMEMKLRESPEKFSAALLQLGMKYLFVLGMQLLACVCAAMILRRHLMVWKVFAPKFLFEALGFVVSSVSLLIGIALVMRVDSAVSSWFQKLILSRSR